MALVRWLSGPRPDCVICSPFIGGVYEIDTHPPVPVHKNCDCYLRPVDDETAVTQWSWADLPDEARHEWVLHVAYLLRVGIEIHESMQELVAEAEVWNEEHHANGGNMKNAALASLLNGAIDKMVTDDLSRGEIIRQMAEAAGIEPDTVYTILAGEIDSPPDERLRGFADVLGLSFESMADLRSGGKNVLKAFDSNDDWFTVANYIVIFGGRYL
jgi:hypothetical protein